MKDLSADLPALDLAEFGTMEGCAPDVFQIDAEMGELPHLDGDRRQEETGVDVQAIDARKVDLAAAAIDRLPGPREAWHIVTSGKFALWDYVPAVLKLVAPVTIAELHVATLSFSKPNVAQFCELLDSGQIGQAKLLASTYLRATNPDVYEFAMAEVPKRPTAHLLLLRVHAKVVAMKLSDGRTFTIESSANLRSCKAIEQSVATGSPAVYSLHVGWIDDLYARAEAGKLAKAELL